MLYRFPILLCPVVGSSVMRTYVLRIDVGGVFSQQFPHLHAVLTCGNMQGHITMILHEQGYRQVSNNYSKSYCT